MEKNVNFTTKAITDICQGLATRSINGSNNKSASKSTTFKLKTGTDDLITKLRETVSKAKDNNSKPNFLHDTNIFFQKCSFVRCIKPNASQCSGMFDGNLVRSQLISSGSIAYQQLMRVGFPCHMSIADLFNTFKSNLKFEGYCSTNPKKISNILLRSCGLKWKDFKLGNTQIFFRSGKLEILSEKLKEDSQLIIQRLEKLKLLRKKLKVAIIFARFCTMSKRRCKEQINIVNEMQTEAQTDIPRKKVKLDKKSGQIMPIFMRTEGNVNELS